MITIVSMINFRALCLLGITGGGVSFALPDSYVASQKPVSKCGSATLDRCSGLWPHFYSLSANFEAAVEVVLGGRHSSLMVDDVVKVMQVLVKDARILWWKNIDLFPQEHQESAKKVAAVWNKYSKAVHNGSMDKILEFFKSISEDKSHIEKLDESTCKLATTFTEMMRVTVSSFVCNKLADCEVTGWAAANTDSVDFFAKSLLLVHDGDSKKAEIEAKLKGWFGDDKQFTFMTKDDFTAEVKKSFDAANEVVQTVAAKDIAKFLSFVGLCIAFYYREALGGAIGKYSPSVGSFVSRHTSLFTGGAAPAAFSGAGYKIG